MALALVACALGACGSADLPSTAPRSAAGAGSEREAERVAPPQDCTTRCGGCCTSAAECIPREGGDPTACTTPLRVALERVRLSYGHCGPVDGQCDYIVVFTVAGDQPVTHGLGDGRDDARVDITIVEGRASALLGWSAAVRVLDDDEYMDDELGTCTVGFTAEQVLAAVTSRDGIHLEVPCGQVTVGVHAGLRPPLR